jgi:hypothetical protein
MHAGWGGRRPEEAGGVEGALWMEEVNKQGLLSFSLLFISSLVSSVKKSGPYITSLLEF